MPHAHMLEPVTPNNAKYRPFPYMYVRANVTKETRTVDRTNTRSLARSTPYGRLKGFVVVVVVAPNAAAGAPRHASVFVAARGRVRSGGCGSLVSTVGKRIQIVIVLREAEA